MFRRLKALYARYAAVHLVASLPGPQIRDSDGARVGYVDRITLGQGRIQVSGWTLARQVRLVLGAAEIEAEPVLRRTDVARALGVPETVGFDLTLPVLVTDLLRADEAPGLVLFAREGHPDIPSLPLPIRLPRRAKLRVMLQFSRDIALALPSMLGWLSKRDPIYRARIKEQLRLGIHRVAAGPLEPYLFRAFDDAVDPDLPEPRLSIVLPVYNAYELLDECLSRVAQNTDLPWRLIVIEDGSPDPRIRPFLTQRLAEMKAAGHDVTLLENPKNLGFIRSVNRGLDEAKRLATGPALKGIRPLSATQDTPEGPVILLNSDAFVPKGWARRLIRPFLMYDDVATVTPMSNDAEIFTVPVMCARTVLLPGQGDAIDRTAQTFSPDALVSLAPTGVGFCMAMGRDWLEQVPKLDTVFGRGYGEEVDWCQKVARLGGKHLGLPGLFVEHRGGESFGSVEKLALVAKNNDIVARRYPGYDQSVQDFITVDPMATARLALGLAWAGSLDPDQAVPVYLAHTMGGGADHWLEHQVSADLEQGRPSVILRVGGPVRWRLELVTPTGRTHGQSDRDDIIQHLLAVLPKRRVIYSCGVGDSDPVDLPRMLKELMSGDADEAEILFHDFFPLTPAYTLLGSDGVYRGAPVAGQTDDPAHTTSRPENAGADLTVADNIGAGHTGTKKAGVINAGPDDTWVRDAQGKKPASDARSSHDSGLGAGRLDAQRADDRAPSTKTSKTRTSKTSDPDDIRVDLATWQAAWRDFAIRARLTVFSEASARDVRAVWPDLAHQIIVRPHTLRHAVPRLPSPAPDAPKVLAVLGNIGFQKGAAILQDLARKIGTEPGAPRLVLIGNIDPAYALPASITVHGTYSVEDLPALVGRYGVTHWLIPSIWPETFCYTAHETLATGLPVLAFDIGAQGEAMLAAPNGHQMPFDAGGDLAQTILTTLSQITHDPVCAGNDKNEKAIS